MNNQVERLNQLSVGEIRKLFCTLSPPEAASMSGLFRGIFVGPGWLCSLWGPLLAITGLGGWWGKEIDSGNAINIVVHKGNYEKRFPMVFVEQTSYLDGKPGLAFRYQKGNPFPWPWIVDELRRIDAQHVLGMTLAEVGPFKRLPFPFILQQRESLDGL
ncbi:MAG: hypothetical protein JXB15_02790 [Anaerolineales bacterium]|nr:hypothetical protein [Anaerolineales bacterium]